MLAPFPCTGPRLSPRRSLTGDSLLSRNDTMEAVTGCLGVELPFAYGRGRITHHAPRQPLPDGVILDHLLGERIAQADRFARGVEELSSGKAVYARAPP